MIQYFLARAKGGVGLLTSGLVPISDGIDNTVQEPDKKVMMPRISPARTLMSGWRDLAQGCHAYGSRFFIQLTPGLAVWAPLPAWCSSISSRCPLLLIPTSTFRKCPACG